MVYSMLIIAYQTLEIVMQQYRKPADLVSIIELDDQNTGDDKTLLLEQRLQGLQAMISRQDRMIKRLQTEISVLRTAVTQYR